jgi:AraC-like DNA-binding protein
LNGPIGSAALTGHVGQTRAAALTDYFEVARFVGLDPDEMLRRVKISPAALEDPDNLLPARTVGRLLEESAQLSGCPSFGLLMAESRNLASLGPISLLLTHQATAREALTALVQYQSVFNEIVSLSIEEADGLTILGTGFAGATIRVQPVELLMGVLCRTISEVVGGRWHPDFAYFTHAAPADTSVHARVFQCPVIFEGDFNGLVCSTASLDAPNPRAESAMARHARRYLDMLVRDSPDGAVSERALRSLYLLLPAGRATLEQLGANLGMHPRALQRQLEREGRTFATLLNEARRELALRYLASPAHSVGNVAQLTGYSTPSSFSRWFATEFDMSPAAWRAEERRDEAIPA